MGRFDLTEHHLAVHGPGRKKGDQEIGALQFVLDALGPGRSDRHRLVDEHLV
jgi:hypothetical protein